MLNASMGTAGPVWPLGDYATLSIRVTSTIFAQTAVNSGEAANILGVGA
jgi:hypothetical protein